MAVLDFSRTISAPAEIVFEVATDHRAMPGFTRFRAVDLEREGEPAPNGVGAIRVLRLLGPPVREEVVSYEPPRRFGYRLLSGVPVRDHTGTIELTPVTAGTRMSYVVETTPDLPVGGFAVLAVLRAVIGDIAAGIATEAEKRAAARG